MYTPSSNVVTVRGQTESLIAEEQLGNVRLDGFRKAVIDLSDHFRSPENPALVQVYWPPCTACTDAALHCLSGGGDIRDWDGLRDI